MIYDIPEKNLQVLTKYFDGWEKGNVSVVDECFAEQFLAHGHGRTQTISRQRYREILGNFSKSFSSMQIKKEVMFAKDDKVAMAFSGKLTHNSTGKLITRFRAVNIYRFENGRIAEFWFGRDELAFYQDLGVVPSDEEIRLRMKD